MTEENKVSYFFHQCGADQSGCVQIYTFDFYKPLQERYQNKKFFQKISVIQRKRWAVDNHNLELILDITDKKHEGLVVNDEAVSEKTEKLFNKIFEKYASIEKPMQKKYNLDKGENLFFLNELEVLELIVKQEEKNE